MICCVPECSSSSLQKWTTNLPTDEQLLERWKAAIQAGIGQYLPHGIVQGHAQICNLHFEADSLEPSLFFRGNVQFTVASCMLCLRYDTTDAMFNMEDCFVQGESLQRLVNKYFKQSTKKSIKKRYYCEMCTVRIDMTHTFWQEIDEAAQQFKNLLRKNVKQKVLVKNTFPDKIENIVKNESMTMDSELIPYDASQTEREPGDESDSESATLEHIFVKEETRLTESYSPGNEAISSKHTEQTSNSDERQSTETSNETLKSLYECCICDSVFENEETLIHHLKVEYKDRKTYICEECKISFDNVQLLNSHLKMHKAKKPKNLKIAFECSGCPPSFNSDNARKKHEINEHGLDHTISTKKRPLRLSCNVCKKTFSKLYSLDTHLKSHHLVKKPFKCNLCDAAFIRERYLNLHAAEAHGQANSHEPLISAIRDGGMTGMLRRATCNVCQAVFQQLNEVVTHFKEVHPTVNLKLYSCAKCEEVFFTPRSAMNHKKLHNDKFACDYCGKRHYYKSNLDRHLYLVHGMGTYKSEKRYSCHICDKSFLAQVFLRKHMLTHNEDSLHMCPDCGKTVSSTRSLTRHIKRCKHKI